MMTKEFAEAFDKNKGAMYRAARSTGASHAKAQDAVSRAAERLMAMQDTILYADEKKTRGLFTLAARSDAITAHNKAMKDVGLATDYMEVHPTETPVGSMDRAIFVHQALSKLDEMERFIAWKYFALELSLQELVEELRERGVEWSRQNLHKTIRKIRVKLRVIMTSMGG